MDDRPAERPKLTAALALGAGLLVCAAPLVLASVANAGAVRDRIATIRAAFETGELSIVSTEAGADLPSQQKPFGDGG